MSRVAIFCSLFSTAQFCHILQLQSATIVKSKSQTSKFSFTCFTSSLNITGLVSQDFTWAIQVAIDQVSSLTQCSISTGHLDFILGFNLLALIF
jgi:hypothetical protein